MSDLLERTAAFVDVSSVSHDEVALADLIEGVLRAADRFEVIRVKDNIVARTHLGRAARIVLGGHLDTVPPSDNAKAKLDGDRLFGCGSADMKGGLAVLIEIAETLREPSLDVTLVFYACEEIARRYSGLLEIEREDPALLAADVAVLLEPTAARVEAGCQGVLRVEIVVGGERAHSARPWAGVNAIHRLSEVLRRIEEFPDRHPVIDGCAYRESVQAVQVEGGVAGNVVPNEARLVLSHRFAPDRDAEEAYRVLSSFFAPVIDPAKGDRITLVESAPSAKPFLDHPVLKELVVASGAEPAAKLAWTDVAFFAERGIPAANYGPGDPLVAHSREEFVERGALHAVYACLDRLLHDSK